jgi:biopolymer transport protein ExbD
MAMSIGDKDEGAVMSDINVTPLVDVMLVLLIIFIITIPVIVAQVHLDLPKATNLPTQTKPENITISVDKDGDVYWNTKKLASKEDLKTELRGIARNVRYMYVGQVLVAAQQIGIRKVAFLTEPDHLGAGAQ